MKPLKPVLALFILFFFPSPFQGQEKPNPPLIPWQTLSQGLSFIRWGVHSQNTGVNSMVALRIEPELWTFRVFFNREPKTIKEWQQTTGATVVCNGSFYQENFEPAGRILVNGTSLGPFRNRHMKGMFLAEPKKGFEHLPKATLIDLKNEKSEEMISSYEQGIQSFPILLDPKGQVRVNQSSFQANRTVLGLDRYGNLYILITEKPTFTLYDLGHYLKSLPLSFQFILNLDGGNRTQLMVQTKGFKYLFTGKEDATETTRFLFPDPVRLPSVIGIFPRGLH